MAEPGADGEVYFTLLLPLVGIEPATGPLSGGTVVTVTGNEFLPGATNVSIGGRACRFVVVRSDESLTCVVPAGAAAGAVDVVVTIINQPYSLPAAYNSTNAAPPGYAMTIPPTLEINATLIGGDVDTLLLNNLGGLLRKAIASVANASGFPDVTVTLDGGIVSYLTVNASDLLDLTGSYINGSQALLAAAVPAGFLPAPGANGAYPSASATVTPSQTPSNTPSPLACDLDCCIVEDGQCLCDRRLNGANSDGYLALNRRLETQAICAPIDLSSVSGTVTIPVVRAFLKLTLPLSFDTALDGGSHLQFERIMRVVESIFLQTLATQGGSNEEVVAFAASWAGCTGMPYTPAVIGEVRTDVVSAPQPATPSATPPAAATATATRSRTATASSSRGASPAQVRVHGVPASQPRGAVRLHVLHGMTAASR